MQFKSRFSLPCPKTPSNLRANRRLTQVFGLIILTYSHYAAAELSGTLSQMVLPTVQIGSSARINLSTDNRLTGSGFLQSDNRAGQHKSALLQLEYAVIGQYYRLDLSLTDIAIAVDRWAIAASGALICEQKNQSFFLQALDSDIDIKIAGEFTIIATTSMLNPWLNISLTPSDLIPPSCSGI